MTELTRKAGYFAWFITMVLLCFSLYKRHAWVAGLPTSINEMIPKNPFERMFLATLVLAGPTSVFVFLATGRRILIQLGFVALMVIAVIEISVQLGFFHGITLSPKHTITDYASEYEIVYRVAVPRSGGNATIQFQGPHGILGPNDKDITNLDGMGAYYWNPNEQWALFSTIDNKPISAVNSSEYKWYLIPKLKFRDIFGWFFSTLILLDLLRTNENERGVEKR